MERMYKTKIGFFSTPSGSTLEYSAVTDMYHVNDMAFTEDFIQRNSHLFERVEEKKPTVGVIINYAECVGGNMDIHVHATLIFPIEYRLNAEDIMKKIEDALNPS